MFGFGPATRIYLAAGATDMRKGYEGLFDLVRDRLECEPLSLACVSVLKRAAQPRRRPWLGNFHESDH